MQVLMIVRSPVSVLRMIFMADVPSGMPSRDGRSALYICHAIR